MSSDKERSLPIVRRDSSKVVTSSDLDFNMGLIKPSLTESRRVAIGKKEEEVRTSGDGKKKWRRPMKLDYFLVTLCEKDERDDFIVDRKFHEKWGDKPREIPIKLLFDRITLNAFVYLGLYTGRRASCKGNGKLAERIMTNGERKSVDCPCKYLDEGRCKPHLRFQFQLPGMGMGEVAVFRSTGRTTISRILGSLAIIKENVAKELGVPFDMAPISDIVLKLRFSKKTVTDKEGKARTIPVVHVVYDGTYEELVDMVKKHQKRYQNTQIYMRQLEMEKEQVKLLPAPEPEEVRQDIAAEFHPDEMDQPKDLAPSQKKEKKERDLAEEDQIQAGAKKAIDASELPEGMKETLSKEEEEEQDFFDEEPEEEKPKPKERKSDDRGDEDDSSFL